MKVVYNNLIPFKGYKAINLFGIVFARKGAVLTDKDLNHEAIHTAQMKEMLYLLFYVWYVVEWIVRLFGKGNAYRNISFEQEAYANDDNSPDAGRRVTCPLHSSHTTVSEQR